MTELLVIDANTPQAAALESAASLLRAGELVAFATETVYGLGADATQDEAVAKIFAAKGRPQTNPLIAHVASTEMARAWAGSWPAVAGALAGAFWPGPLTLVVRRTARFAPAVSAGLETVALRVPEPAVARGLIAALGRPVAAPSANRSEHVSPTIAQHVMDDLEGQVALVLDSGPTGVGIESTVVDVTGEVPTVLRRGPIGVERLRGVVGDLRVIDQRADGSEAQASPGQSVRHYAPDVPCVRVESGYEAREGDAMIALGRSVPGAIVLPTPEAAARELYALLRRLEGEGVAKIVVVMPPDESQWAAVRDRLVRATVAVDR